MRVRAWSTGAWVALAATTACAQPLAGRWALSGAPTVFRFEPCGSATCGRLETSPRIQADADARDLRNRNPSLRQRKLKELVVFQALQPVRAGVWKGRVYVPGEGNDYAVTVSRAGEGRLTAKGCAAPLLCQTSVLTSVP